MKQINLALLAHYLETENAVHKYHDNQAFDISKIDFFHAERRRREWYHQLGLPSASVMLKESVENEIPLDSNINYKPSENSWKDLKAKCQFIHDQGLIENAHELAKHFDWKWEKISRNRKKLVPENEEAVARYLCTPLEHLKYNAQGNYVRGFAEIQTASKREVPLPDRSTFVPVFSGLDETSFQLEFTSENIKEILDDFNFQEVALYERNFIGLFRLTGAKSFDVELIHSGKKLDLHHAADIGALLNMISRIYIKRLDLHVSAEVKRCEEEAFRKSPKLDQYAFQKAQLFKKPDNPYMQMAFDAIKDDPEVREAWEHVHQEERLVIDPQYTLVKFEKKELLQLIVEAFGYEEEEVLSILELLSFNKSVARYPDHTQINYQPLLEIGSTYYWLPNSLGYTSVMESILHTCITQKLVNIDRLSSDLVENGFTQFLKDAGFNIIEKPKKRKVKHPITKNEVGDLDIAGFKAGYFYHFELKLTGIRNAFSQKALFRRTLQDAGDRQLPNMRRYYESFSEDFLERFGLPANTEVKGFYQFIVSNSFDFDYQEFNGHKKISLLELLINLKAPSHEAFLFVDGIDWMKNVIQWIDKTSFTTIPPKYLKWAKDELAISDLDTLWLIKNYVNHNFKNLSESERRHFSHPLQAIIDLSPFRYLALVDPVLEYLEVKSGKMILEVPTYRY